MRLVPMPDYESAHRHFKWEIPETFNFGTDVVDQWATNPDQLALIWCNHEGAEARFTYADIARLASQFANLMTASGVYKGDRVLVMLPRIPAWQIAMVGCLKMGLVPIPCITMLTASDIAYRIKDAQAVAVVTTVENTN